MKPALKFRHRSKKSGAAKRQRLLSQKRRLIVAGYSKEQLDKLAPPEIRELLKNAGKKKVIARIAKKAKTNLIAKKKKPTAKAKK